jgi:hypothetical protein
MGRLSLLLALWSIPFAARGEKGGIVLAAGAGSAYDGIGVHLELGAESFAVFVGTGLPLLQRFRSNVADHHDFVLGMRFFSGNLDRFFFSAQATFAVPSDPHQSIIGDSSRGRESLKTLGVTAGWRWGFGAHHLLELGGGLLCCGFGPVGVYIFSPDISLAYGLRF